MLNAYSILRRTQLCLAVAATSAMIGVTGCGSGSNGTVTGTVTQGDKPLADAWVEFKPESGRIASGRTDAQGYYELTYGPDQKGTLPGKNEVTIGTGGVETPDGRDVTKKVTLKTETVTVEAGSQTLDFKVPATIGRE